MYSYNCDSPKPVNYGQKHPKDWNEQDCLEWASYMEHHLAIPISRCVHIGSFAKVNGRDLCRYDEQSFKRMVNEEYGGIFYKAFRKLLRQKDRKPSQDGRSMYHKPYTSDTYQETIDNSSNWSVPQMQYDIGCLAMDYGLTPESSLIPKCSSSNFTLNSNNFGNDFGDSYNSGCVFPCTMSLDNSINDRFLHSFEETSTYTNNHNGNHFTAGPSFQDYREEWMPLPEVNALTLEDSTASSLDYLGILEGYTSLTTHHTGINPFFDSLDSSELPAILDVEDHDEESLDQAINQSYACSSEPRTDETYQLQGTQSVRPKTRRRTEKEDTIEPVDLILIQELIEKVPNSKRPDKKRHPKIYEFLKRLILHPRTRDWLITWEDREKGYFRLLKPRTIAFIWGRRSPNRDESAPMDYNNLAKNIRNQYDDKILLPVREKKLVFGFGEKILEEINVAEAHLGPFSL